MSRISYKSNKVQTQLKQNISWKHVGFFFFKCAIPIQNILTLNIHKYIKTSTLCREFKSVCTSLSLSLIHSTVFFWCSLILNFGHGHRKWYETKGVQLSLSKVSPKISFLAEWDSCHEVLCTADGRTRSPDGDLSMLLKTFQLSLLLQETIIMKYSLTFTAFIMVQH